MTKMIVIGIGTEVGKTVVSAILTTLLSGDYWKPIECGGSDSRAVQELLDPVRHCVHKSAYSFSKPVSPHEAAAHEEVEISLKHLKVPFTKRPLVIETAGGICTPLTLRMTNIELLQYLHSPLVVVSKHYLGSINHTLLTVDSLKKRGLSIVGIIFNGSPNVATEQAILEMTELPLLGRIFPEPIINTHIVKRYAAGWKQNFIQYLC